MTTFESVLLNVYGVIVATWVIRHLVITLIYRKLDVVGLDSPKVDGPDAPLVTALIPAKDEEESLPACLATVRAQSYPNLEILIVDDRSTDRTPEIAREAVESDPRVRVVTLTELPPGWTGKTHALHAATAEARGDWLWYVDADTLHSPDSLAIMMGYARRQGAEMVSLLPTTRCESFWEKVLQPLEGIVLMRSYPLFQANGTTSPIAFANGQYILISRAAYDASGGHQAVRDRFVEDIALARRVKATGRRVCTALTTEIGSTRMYTSLSGLIRGWSRILYDAHDRRPWPLVGKIVEPLVFSQSGDIALIAALILLLIGHGGPFARWLLGLSLVHQVLKQWVLYRMYRWSGPATAGYAIYYPLAGIVSAWISLKSILMCLTGRVSWRGTTYGAMAPAPQPVAAIEPANPA